MSVLTFELTAARIIAPYLGDTIYTWTSIIGVILAALAFGYYKGGAWADKRQQPRDIIVSLLAAAVLIAIVSVSKDWVLVRLAEQTMPLQISALFASLFLFALPTFALGVIPPYVARLSIDSVATSGRHLSRVDAAGTIGSLTGTFLTGYVLFGMIGSRYLLALLSVMLVVSTILIRDKYLRSFRVVLLVLLILVGFAAPRPSLSGFVDEIDTAYSRIIVRDVSDGIRQMRIYQTDNSGLQSGVYTDGDKAQPFAYIRGFSYLSELKPDANRYLIIGGGAFTFPEYLATQNPNARIDTVEIDEKLPAISQRYFGFDQPANLRIIHDDGRAYLNSNQVKYDMIFLDAFSSLVPPFQLLTTEAADRTAQSLNNNGVMVTNVISSIEGPDSNMAKHVVSTLRTSFSHVIIYPASVNDNIATQNLLVVASKQPLNEARLQQIARGSGEFATMLAGAATIKPNEKTILTDDFAPVEQLVH